MKPYKLITITLFSMIFSQFYDVDVSIDVTRVKENDHILSDLFKNLDQEIEKYFISNNFCPEYDYLDIPLKIQFIIENINLSGNNSKISSQVIISNYKDKYYFTGVNFNFGRGESLNYNPSNLESLTAFLDYFAFLYTGNELDTYGYNLGSDYYNLSLEISDEMRFTNYSRDWEERKEEIKLILDNIKLREINYSFYFIDDMILSKSGSTELIKINTKLIYDNLLYIYKKIGYDKNTLKFLYAHNDLLVKLFSSYLDDDVNWAEFLMIFYEKNNEKYEVYLK